MKLLSRLKLAKLNVIGSAHIIAPLVVVVGAGLVGTYLLVASHADTLTATHDVPVPADYTGAHHAELGIWRPSNGTWYVSSNLSGTTTQSAQWGQPGDIPVPGDYNGAGHADYAVWRPSNGTWYVKGVETVAWGQPGDIPVPGDYNGDHKTDLAVYRPSNQMFYVRGVGNYSFTLASDFVGAPTTLHPFASTMSANANDEPCVYYFDKSGKGQELCKDMHGTGYSGPFAYGLTGDIPTPFRNVQYSGYTNFGVWRPGNGTWYISSIPGPTLFATAAWGQNGDIPLAEDYNGDGKTDFAVWRHSNGTWYIRGIKTVKYGIAY